MSTPLNAATPALAIDQHREDGLSLRDKIALLWQHVKYVFVIFHENESFDHFFGAFPGANGLFTAPQGSTPANQTGSWTQSYLDTNGAVVTQTPFLMPQAVVSGDGKNAVIPVYPADFVSFDYSHQGMANSMHIVDGVAKNDQTV